MTRSRLMPVLLAAALLVGAANLGAYAATGSPLLLGKSNTATKTTKLKTTGNGPALKLKTKAGKPPLKVSSTGKVKKLNADLVDGLDSPALQTKSYVYDLVAAAIPNTYVSFALPGLPPGKYVASFSVAAGIEGAAALFACFLITGTGASTQLPVTAIGTNNGSDGWFASGSGFVDTTSSTHRFVCQRSGGTSTTIPASPVYTSRLVMTRVDDATTSTATGVGGSSPRGVAP